MVLLTYAGVLAAFLLVPLVGLAGALRWREAPPAVPGLLVGGLVAIALAYTTPWEVALVGAGTWQYGAGVVWARLWGVPIEEYAFIATQTLLVSLWVAHLPRERAGWPSVSRRARVAGGLAGLGVGVAGLLAWHVAGWRYLGAILVWAAPVLALQWAVGLPVLVGSWQRVAAGVGVPTVYLTAVDAVAIRAGVWTITPAWTTGLAVGGVPVEEPLFFATTSLFLVQAVVLYPWVVARWR